MQGKNSVNCCHNDCSVLSRSVAKQASGVYVCEHAICAAVSASKWDVCVLCTDVKTPGKSLLCYERFWLVHVFDGGYTPGNKREGRVEGEKE